MKKNIINQKELARIVSTKKELSKKTKKEIENIIKIIFQEIMEQLKNDRSVKITSFGTFSTKTRYARAGVNPRNPKDIIKIPTVRVAKFKTGKKLKDTLK